MRHPEVGTIMSRLRGFLCAATVSSALVNAATTTTSLSINSVLGYFFNDDGDRTYLPTS